MTKVRATIVPDGTLRAVPGGKRLQGRLNAARVDGTTEAEISRQSAADDMKARKSAAAYAHHVRRQTGLSQAAFAECIGVPIDTRNWEQGKRLPAGPAKALLKVIHRAPEAALAALK
jgi:putative transcriptional regulator